MQRLLVSQVSILRPTAGFLPGMRCPPNLAPPANWGDLTQGPGAAAARSWLHGHSSPRASTAAVPSATPQWRLQLNLRAASGDQLTRGVNWSDQPTNRNWLVGASTLQTSPSNGTSGGTDCAGSTTTGAAETRISFSCFTTRRRPKRVQFLWNKRPIFLATHGDKVIPLIWGRQFPEELHLLQHPQEVQNVLTALQCWWVWVSDLPTADGVHADQPIRL